ncbi:MAG: DUF4136 domain-containing protein [Chitinophagaceae bacterium]|nr:MAG: DUF4136 domain-containing protein [Chitinophagaceae bacterium]
MKNYILPFVLLFMLSAGMVGCSKDPLRDMTAEESRIYITNRDSSINFSNFRTFSIADSVSVISNNKLEGRESSELDRLYTDAVRQQMIARGYTEVANDANPDFGINVSRLYNSSTGVVSYPDYWGGYYDFYDPFYWGYPGYGYGFPGYYGVYQITEGALSIDILDIKDASANKTINLVWNGLVRGSGVFNTGTAATNVKALFDQSGYITTNQ